MRASARWQIRDARGVRGPASNHVHNTLQRAEIRYWKGLDITRMTEDGAVTLIQDRVREHGRTCTHRTASASPQQARRGGRIRPCVLSWKYTRLRPRADRLSGTAWRPGTAGRPGAATSASRAVCVHACWVCQCVVTPLLPRMKASPYLALSWPFTYSSVCSIAMFMKPSRHASTPVPQLASSAYA